MSSQEKIDLAQELRNINIELLTAGIRRREGALSPDRMRLEILRHILPAALFARYYGGAR